MASMVIGHPENVLLNMMIDERKHTRDLAARRIKVKREADRCHQSSSGDVRKLTIPKLSFEATDYYELVKWLDFNRREPPITCTFTENDREEAIKTGIMSDLEKYPCHTQAVERHV